MFFLFSGLSAGVLYVSPVGDDTNVGTSEAPFKTLSYALSVASSGDEIRLAAGNYPGGIVINTQATPENPITIIGEGNNAGRPLAVISNFTSVTPGQDGFGDWALHAGEIWKLQLPSSGWALPLGRNLVMVDGEPLIPARWPDAVRPVDFDRRAMAEAFEGGLDINSRGPQAPYSAEDFYTGYYRDTQLTEFDTDAWVGAHVDLCTGHNWWDKSGVVVGNSNDTLLFRYRFSENWDPVLDTPKQKDRYALWGHLSALTTAGEFFIDVAGINGPANTLYLWLPGDESPVGKDIALRVRETGIHLSGAKHLRFQNISLEGGNIIANNGASDSIFEGVFMRYAALNRNLLQWGGNRAVHFSGERLEFNHGTILEVDGAGLFTEGTANRFENNVVGYTRSHSLSLDGAVDGEFIRNTAFAGGNTLVAMGAKSSLIHLNHVYLGGLRITDIALMNTWNSGDMQGTEISYNWAHTNLAPRDGELSWWGGQGIRLDSGEAPLGCSNTKIHHNAVWGTTSTSGITAWFLTPDQLNYGDSKIEFHHNTVIGHAVLGGDSEQASGQGHSLRRNIAARFGGAAVLKGADIAENLFWEHSVADNLMANPKFSSAVNHHYTLTQDSPARSFGTALNGFSEPSSTPYLGAYNPDREPWRPGALLRESDLTDLTAEVIYNGRGARVLKVSGLPIGRTFPNSFALRLGAQTATEMEVSYNFESHFSHALFVVDLSQAGATETWEVSLDGVSFVTPQANTVHIPQAELTLQSSLVGLGTGGDLQTLATSQLPGDTRVHLAIRFEGLLPSDLYINPVPIIVNTASWIQSGMAEDASDLCFYAGDGSVQLRHYIESGLGTTHTLIWLKSAPSTPGYTLQSNITQSDLSTLYASFGDGVNYQTHDSNLLQERYPFLTSSSRLMHLHANRLADSHKHEDAVSQWNDSSANDNHAVQSTSARMPRYWENRINGLGAVSFDGEFHYLDVNGSEGLGIGPHHTFVVARHPEPGAKLWQRILTARNSTEDNDWETGISVAPNNLNGVTLSQPTPRIHEFSSSSLTSSREHLRIAARSISTASEYKGEIGEILVLNEALPWGNTLLDIRHYLNRKWGMADRPTFALETHLDVHGIRVRIGGELATHVSLNEQGVLSFKAPAYSGSEPLPHTVPAIVELPDGSQLVIEGGYTYEPSVTLVEDGFDDGTTVKGDDVLAVNWVATGGELSVVSDPLLDPTSPNHALSLFINSTDQTLKDEYIGFSIPEPVSLEIGEVLRLSFNLRYSGNPLDTASRTGVSFAYRESGITPWSDPANHEYFFMTSFGHAGQLGSLRKSSGQQLINVGTVLAENQPSVSLGTESGSVVFDVARISPNRIRVRYQLNNEPIAEYIDKESLLFDFNRVFLRFRRATASPLESIHLDNVRLTRELVDTVLEVPQAPIDTQAVMKSSTALTLTWKQGDPYTLGYQIERENDLGEFVVIATLPVEQLSWVDSGLTPDLSYTYRMRTIGVESSSPATAPYSASTASQTLLVFDDFEDGTVNQGIESADVNWNVNGGAFNVASDALFDPIVPHYVGHATVSANANYQDTYLGFRLPQAVELNVGEGLRLRYEVRFPEGARSDTSRTGFAFAYRAPDTGDSPWVNEHNREYAVFTSFGNSSPIGSITKSSGYQFLNRDMEDTHLKANTTAINLSNTVGVVVFEMVRFDTDKMLIRYKLNDLPIEEVVDSTNIQTIITHFFMRYRSDSTEEIRNWQIDNVSLHKLEAGSSNSGIYTSLEYWLLEHFGIVETSGIAGLLEDPDNDGIPNLIEYAFASNPRLSENDYLTQFSLDAEGALIFSYFHARSDIAYTLETSTNLEVWHAAEVDTQAGVVGSWMTLTLPRLEEERRFYRLRVTQN